MISEGTQSAADSVMITSKNTGTAIIVYSQKTVQSIVTTGGRFWGAIKDGATNIWQSKAEPDQPETLTEDEETGLFSKIVGRFRSTDPIEDDAKDDIDLGSINSDLLLEKLRQAEMTDETIIGMVSAGDEIADSPDTGDGYLQKISEVFAWRRNNETSDSESEAELVDELYRSELPATLVVIDEESADEKGILAKVVSVFKRE